MKSSTEDPLIEAQGVSYHYPDGSAALNGMDLSVLAGSITGLLGANGAGKSTLFLTMNGILKPSSGTLFWRGAPLDYSRSGLRTLRGQVGMVFQDPDSQLFSASVLEDISFGAVNLGLPAPEVKRRVEAAMERTGISDLRGKPTHCLSFGQKKRVAIAGVLVMQPQLLVLDEPTAGLDPLGCDQIMKLLVQTRDELGISLVLATHDVDVVALYCDQVAVMDRGRRVMQGRPSEIFAESQALRSYNLRLPRIGHLMEVLDVKDGLAIDRSAMTIAAGRRAIRELVEQTKGSQVCMKP